MILVSLAVHNLSSMEVSAWDISGFMDARVHDCNSVPYRCFTSLGNSGLINLSQVSTIKFSSVGVSSSSSVVTWPQWERLWAWSRVSSTKAISLWKRTSGHSSASRCRFAKSRKWAPVIWKPKWSHIMLQTDWMEVKFFIKVFLDMTGQ